MKAREWYERGVRAIEAPDALSNFWRGFNNLFFPITANGEREKIKQFIALNINQTQATEILNNYANEVSYLLSQPVIDMKGNGKDTGVSIQAYQASNDAIIKLQEIFMVIYQVRCNLEHGQKSPNRVRDNELCKSASPIVAHVVNIYA